MLRALLPLLKRPRSRALLVPVVEIAGTVCLVVAAWRASTTLGVAAMGVALLIAALPIEDWANRPRP